MPTYEATLPDGRKVEFDADREPTEEEFNQSFGALEQPQEAELRPMTFGERWQTSPLRRTLFGPPESEVSQMAGGNVGNQVGVVQIPQRMLEFTRPGLPFVKKALEPIQKAEDELSGKAIDFLPDGLKKVALAYRGARKGIRDFALDTPIAPIPGMTQGKAALVALSAFGADFLSHQPEIYDQFKAALDKGDVETASKIAASDIAGGALLGLGAKHGIEEVRTKGEPNAIPEPPTAESVLRDEGVRRESGLPRVEPENRPEIPAETETIARSESQESSAPVDVGPTEEPVKTPRQRYDELVAVMKDPNIAPEIKGDAWLELEAIKDLSAQQGAEPGAVENPQTKLAPSTPASELVPPEIKDWVSATEESTPKTAPPETKSAEEPPVAYQGLNLPKFPNRKQSQLDAATSSHSAKLQKSFDEATRAQKELGKMKEPRQNAISVWLEAKGDVPTLQGWEAGARGKVFKKAAADALTLTPEEIATANRVRAAFDTLHSRGQRFDVINSFRDAYVPHVWDVPKPGSGFLGSRVLQNRFKFSKARSFNNFFEGDQAGFKPKTLAIGKLLPAYIAEINKVIADRQFVQEMAGKTAKDGRPLLIPRGYTKEVTDPTTGATSYLTIPRGQRLMKNASGTPIDQSDYKTLENQPALRDWKWVSKDENDNPMFLQSDLSLHPEAYKRLNAVLGQSAIRQWYREPSTGPVVIPKAIVKGIDTGQAAMKREMFGLLAPFHQVQEGTHAVGHLVNPFFGIPKVDLRVPEQMDAARHGLMLLPDRTTARTYMEGVGANRSLITRGLRGAKLNFVADIIDGYQDYLFHQYIPGLKFKTYEAMLGRNTKLYQPEIARGEVTLSDIKTLTAEQANAAYGHLNYALLDRNPTIQHLIQLGALAPDFLEARGRFVGQAIKGLNSKVGNEQLKAVAILAAAQAGSAYILSSLLGDKYDPKHPFEVVHKGRRYTLRSVPEDIYSLIKDTRSFAYGRLNPMTAKAPIQYATGLNYRGEKVTPLETTTELLAGFIPITARPIPGVRELTETSRQSPTSPLEQLAGSMGLRISRYSPISETYKLAGDWLEKQKLPKDRGSYPISKYQQLRYALEDSNEEQALAEYKKLLETMPSSKITTGFYESINHPFTGSRSNDTKFRDSLKGYDRELYDLAVKRRQEIIWRYNNLKK